MVAEIFLSKKYDFNYSWQSCKSGFVYPCRSMYVDITYYPAPKPNHPSYLKSKP